jgi:hypothetical protein
MFIETEYMYCFTTYSSQLDNISWMHFQVYVYQVLPNRLNVDNFFASDLLGLWDSIAHYGPIFSNIQVHIFHVTARYPSREKVEPVILTEHICQFQVLRDFTLTG